MSQSDNMPQDEKIEDKLDRKLADGSNHENHDIVDEELVADIDDANEQDYDDDEADEAEGDDVQGLDVESLMARAFNGGVRNVSGVGTEDSRFGFIAIVGRPNVGKSTLMNHLIGQKISITSRKPQTTRNRVVGIDTDGPYQVVYVDTPGLHKVEKRAINRLMNRAAESSLGDVELILWVIDATFWTEDDDLVYQKLERAEAPVVLVINKVDKLNDKEQLLPLIERLKDRMDFKDIVPVSALKGSNLKALKTMVQECLPEGPHLYSEDSVTDRSMRFLTAEIIREKLMRQMGEELPYSASVEIEQFKEDDKGVTHINAAILVERQGQKKMVVGAGGSRIKRIGTEARQDIERLLNGKVFLSLFVKVKAGWADDERALKSLGYADFEGR